MKKRSLTRVISNLIDGAVGERCLCNGDATQYRIRNHGYAKLEDWRKPGRNIMRLDPEDREILKEAKEKDFNGRLF
jgi:uncharacterized membrane protein